MKKILVIDGNSIINRAFYGIRLLTTHDGRPTNAIYGMLNIVCRHLEAIKPDYAAVAFDLKAPNFRKQRFSYYKEGRHATPPELLAQFADAKECLRLLGLHTLELEGYEADDILGTVSAMAEDNEDIHAYVLSGDRDLLQLISDRVTVLLASTGETVSYDENTFQEKYGLLPSQMVDLKALMGDSSDNIPGVPGIGEKTAVKLLSQFGSLEELYRHAEEPCIAKGAREKLAAGKQSAFDSQWLATICRTVPLGLSLEELSYTGVDCAGLYQKCKELELTQIIKRLGLSPDESSSLCCADCDKKEESAPALSYISVSAQELSEQLGDKFALSKQGDALYFYDGDHAFCYTGDLSQVQELFSDKRQVICFDGKSLLHTLANAGLFPSFIPLDVMLYAYVCQSDDGKRPLSEIAEIYQEPSPAPGEPAAALLFRLESKLRHKVEELGCLSLLQEIELPLSPVLFRMEHTGFRIDRAALEEYGRALSDEVALVTENVLALAGVSFNLNSPKQLSEVLFDRLGLPTQGLKKTRNGYSTDVDTLQSLRHHHPIVDEILHYRQLSKLLSTYVVGLLKLADENGRVHTEFKQALTATGRLSSVEPNLQNIPIRTPLGRELRRCFVPGEPDHVLVDADYSQIELRLLAAFSGDEHMCYAFCHGEDIHRQTAAAVFGVPQEQVTDDMRKSAKAVNFGIVYGISAYSLSGDIHVSVAKAKKYMEDYFAEYPAIRAYLDGVVKQAEKVGYTDTLFGRRRFIPELSSSRFPTRAFGRRVAMNSPIQGTAADIIKRAMVRVDQRLHAEGLPARLILQVHDELIVEAHKSVADKVKQILQQEMEGAVSLCVPLTVGIGVGKDWLSANH